MKTRTKILLTLGVMLIAILLFSTNNVKAESEHYIEEKGIIIYNPYFDTKDMDKVTYNENGSNMGADIVKYNISLTEFEKIKPNSLPEQKILVEVTQDVTEVKICDTVWNEETEETDYIVKANAEIITKNGKRYAVIPCKFASADNGNIQKRIRIFADLQIFKGNNKEEKNVFIQMDLFTTEYFTFHVNIVNENGFVYGTASGTNGLIEGVGGVALPKDLDIHKMYAEVVTNQYIGESIKVNNIGTAKYVGKYGNEYKYKISLKSAVIEEEHLIISINYKGLDKAPGGKPGFYFDEDYKMPKEEYTTQNGTNSSDTNFNFTYAGNFSGTIVAEEIQKGDIIHSKVEEELNKNTNKDTLYTAIRNIYIKNGSQDGKIKLTFNVGEQYNGKSYIVTHLNTFNYKFEKFEGTVKNGQITVEVSTLSPFGIAITENKPTTDKPVETDKGEKDDTPKTGVTQTMYYILPITIISAIGVIALRKKQTK